MRARNLDCDRRTRSSRTKPHGGKPKAYGRCVTACFRGIMDFPEQLERPDFIQPEIVAETAESDGRKNPAHDTQSDPLPSASWGFSAFRHHGSNLTFGRPWAIPTGCPPAIVALDSSLRQNDRNNLPWRTLDEADHGFVENAPGPTAGRAEPARPVARDPSPSGGTTKNGAPAGAPFAEKREMRRLTFSAAAPRGQKAWYRACPSWRRGLPRSFCVRCC